jgi:SAM-dependent methyltransferase
VRDTNGPLALAVMQGAGGIHKAQAVVRTFPEIWHGRVIDVGARTREIEAALAGTDTSYIGVDVDPSAEIVADLGDHLPFDDDYAAVITALDVLEHTEDIHHAFSELCRVASDHIVLTLPNEYELENRIKMVRGQPISKYGLTPDPPADRHRWFFALDDARRFVYANAERHGWSVQDERAFIGARRAKAVGPLVRRWPKLFSEMYLVHLAKA